MTKAIIYLRSATGNRDQVRQQAADCRAYLRERDLVDVGTVADTGRPQNGLTTLIDTAVKAGATEVVVTDISRLGRRPQCATSLRSTKRDRPSTLPAAPSAVPSSMGASAA